MNDECTHETCERKIEVRKKLKCSEEAASARGIS